jgi:hypothetical protein
MIQSIQSGSNLIYNTANSVTMTEKVKGNETITTSAAAQEDENTTTSSKYDTVTISNAGMQAAQNLTPQVTNSSSDGTYTDSRADALASAAAGAGITETASSENESYSDVSGSSSSDSDLSQYTESELKEMLQNGEITRAEYESEISSRQQSDTASDGQSETSELLSSIDIEA